MQELIDQDLFDQISSVDAVCITTNCTIDNNGNNPMGGGSAGAAAKRWPLLPAIYGRLLLLSANIPIVCGWVNKQDTTLFVSALDTMEELKKSGVWDAKLYASVVAFPTMMDATMPADLDLVVRSAELLEEMASLNAWEKIVIGRPGSGIGGLDYEKQVKPALSQIWNDRFIVMHKTLPKQTIINTEF